jgi:TNF receptor-associated protein 1
MFSTEATTAENHEFKAETRKLLDIVARSLYTDKEVFIRELISNASDALEKFRFLSSTHQIKNIVTPDAHMGITVEVDEVNRTFTISDSGIGMSRAELIENLGTIARSGSKKFLEEVGSSDNKIIGQFGVGFYSSFVVADKVRVYSRSADADKDEHGYMWESDGTGTFSISKDDSVSRGTKIEIHLKEEAADFAKFDLVRSAATKFSSFIDFPIKVITPGEKESAEITQQDALWLKTSATEEQHTDFYRFLSGNSYGEPTYSFFFHTDAPLSIKSVFYVPEDAPEKFFNATSIQKSGIALHSRRVLVTKHADAIVPQWLHWMKGVVDCEDMPLNISRESMQDTALLKKLSNAIVKRILRFLIDEAKKNPEKFAKFYKNYSTYLKAGLLEDMRMNGGAVHKEQLMKLVRFELVKDNKLISLQEYVDQMPETQKSIYYINAPNRSAAQASPYMDGIEGPVLLLTDDIDDFVVNSIGPFQEKMFVSVDSGDSSINRCPQEVSSGDSLSESDKEKLVSLFKSALESRKVADVSFSPMLRSSPAVVTSQLSPHMRKMMKNIIAQSSGQLAKDEDLFDAMPVKLELSETDPLVRSLVNVGEQETGKLIATQIYLNAMISAGMIEDARVVLPAITELVKKCIDQAVSARM